MKAKDIMTTDVFSLSPDTPIQEIARQFRARNLSGAPVIEDGRLIGIVKEVDLIARHARPHAPRYLPLLDAFIPLGGQHEYRELVRRILASTARDLMTSPAISVNAEVAIEDVATLMVERRANPLPVMDGDRMVGILSHTDLIRTLEDVPPLAEG